MKTSLIYKIASLFLKYAFSRYENIKQHLINKYKEEPDQLKKLLDSLEELNKNDPSGSGKYLQWQIKQIEHNENLNDVITCINYFDKNKSRFLQKDINRYSLADLKNEIANMLSVLSKTQEKAKNRKGAVNIYDANNIKIYRINSKKAATQLGKGTKWCITMENDPSDYYGNCRNRNALFYYIIDNNVKSSNDLHKIAVAVFRDKNNNITSFELYNSVDEVLPKNSINPEIYNLIKLDAGNQPAIT